MGDAARALPEAPVPSIGRALVCGAATSVSAVSVAHLAAFALHRLAWWPMPEALKWCEWLTFTSVAALLIWLCRAPFRLAATVTALQSAVVASIALDVAGRVGHPSVRTDTCAVVLALAWTATGAMALARARRPFLVRGADRSAAASAYPRRPVTPSMAGYRGDIGVRAGESRRGPATSARIAGATTDAMAAGMTGPLRTTARRVALGLGASAALFTGAVAAAAGLGTGDGGATTLGCAALGAASLMWSVRLAWRPVTWQLPRGTARHSDAGPIPLLVGVLRWCGDPGTRTRAKDDLTHLLLQATPEALGALGRGDRRRLYALLKLALAMEQPDVDLRAAVVRAAAVSGDTQALPYLACCERACARVEGLADLQQRARACRELLEVRKSAGLLAATLVRPGPASAGGNLVSASEQPDDAPTQLLRPRGTPE